MSEILQLDGLRIAVRRSDRRKHVDLTVERDGAVVIAVPSYLPTPEIERLVRERLVTLHAALSRKREVLSNQPAREYVTGEGFYFLGRKYRLKLVDEESYRGLRLLNGRFVLARPLAGNGQDLFIRWYIDQAQQWIAERIEPLQRRVAARARAVKVRDLGYRWGSCTATGVVYFHWRVILLPSSRIEYLILHELCHLHEHDHSEAFYERLRRASPSYREHECWLRAHGDRYGL